MRLQDVAERIAGPWLRHMLLVGAVVCTAALYANCILISETAMQFFAVEHFSVLLPAQQRSDVSTKSSNGRFKEWLWSSADGCVAPAYVLANAVVASVLVLLPYRVLIEFAITTVALPTLLFLAAFIVLRVRHPTLQDGFRAVPCGSGKGGLCLALLLATPPALLTMAQLFFSLTDRGVDDGEVRGGEKRNAVAWRTIGGVELPLALLAQFLVFLLGLVGQLVGKSLLSPKLSNVKARRASVQTDSGLRRENLVESLRSSIGSG